MFVCVSKTHTIVGALLDYALANYNVDVDRMYIGGFSSGSLESWTIAKGKGEGEGEGEGEC